MKIKWHNDNKLHMQVKENNGVTYLTYPSFEQFPDIVHCFSTRLGGVSQGIFSSMNLSFTRGDEENAVKDNYRRLSAAVGFSLEDIVTSDQTHTTNVQLVGAEDRGKGVTRPRTYKDVDGMIYGMIVNLLFAVVVDKMIYGLNSGKVAFIVTKQGKRICQVIDEASQRGSTILNAQGGYKQDDMQVVMCACNSKEMYQVRKAVQEVDPESFFVVVESHEVHGEGFKMTNIGEAQS